MALRRGVDKTMIKVFEQYEKKDDMDKTQGVKTLLHEFSDEMGVKNFILLILGLLFISVYVAYIITGFSSLSWFYPHLFSVPCLLVLLQDNS
jgi:preprotein translocase subunit SecF